MLSSSLQLSILILIVMMTLWVFINTMITKKWRNRVINESDCWKLGIFYYNPMDTRLFLPKQTGLGFTLNFGQPLSGILLLALIFIIGFIVSIGK